MQDTLGARDYRIHALTVELLRRGAYYIEQYEKLNKRISLFEHVEYHFVLEIKRLIELDNRDTSQIAQLGLKLSHSQKK